MFQQKKKEGDPEKNGYGYREMLMVVTAGDRDRHKGTDLLYFPCLCMF